MNCDAVGRNLKGNSEVAVAVTQHQLIERADKRLSFAKSGRIGRIVQEEFNVNDLIGRTVQSAGNSSDAGTGM